jgi:8-oxo-dGTP diphosphatase
MAKENYVKHFERYMMRTVLEPTAQVRSMLFALMAINESLDILFAMKDFISIKTIEEKIESLRNTRGLLQTKMSLIYNEVDYNRREHSTSVLTHLITQFNLKGIIERIHTKFNVLSDSMELRYQKANRENQARTEHGMTYLNILFSLAAIIQVLAFVFTEDQPLVTGFSTVFLAVISAILILVLKSFFSMKRGEKKANIRKTVDAVIIDPEQENVVLIKRRWPPFKGQWALPGGFIEKSDKSPQEAVTREIEEETGLKLKIEGQIGIYGNPNRDPRGRVITTAFFCSIIGPKELRCSGESTELKFIPLKDLEGINLAFDHEFILKDAIKKFLQKALRS